jgi:CheY-like chemotaxis protein
LGLSLCLGIIEGHGGTIGVESLPRGGAVFRIELPVNAPPATETEAAAVDTEPPLRGKAILVVDDEPGVAAALADLLRLDDHDVETAANGARALDKLRARGYDLILSDIKMPELDGPGLYRELARRYPGLRKRVIFFTGDMLNPTTAAFLEETGLPSLTKPFDMDEVRQAVQRALRAHEQG